MSSGESSGIHKAFRRILSGCLACSVAAGIGCGSRDGPPRAAVSGRVTVDGVPVDDGSIGFSPCDGTSGPTAGGKIAGGEYSIGEDRGPVAGMNLVAIYGSRKTGKKAPNITGRGGQLVEETVPVVPEKYNARSTLKRDLKPGKNDLDFELSSK